ncbi:electron transport complex subunit RsxG [Vibrio sp. RC27]
MSETPETIEVKTDLTPSSTIRPPKEQALRLAAFATVVAFIVMLCDVFIGPTVELRAQEDRQAMFAEVLPISLYDNDPSLEQESVLVDDAPITYYRARLNGEVSALVMQVAPQGYAGAINLLVAAKPDGTITGVRVIGHNETPGLGDNIETSKSDWILQFNGLSLTNPTPDQWGVSKDGGQFDSFTGATITPRAVVAGIKQSLEVIQNNKSDLIGQTHSEESLDD